VKRSGGENVVDVGWVERSETHPLIRLGPVDEGSLVRRVSAARRV